MVTVVAVFILVALSWGYLAAGAGMGSEAMAHDVAGRPLLVLFGMWTVMMVAMMLPGAAPAILLYGALARRSASRPGAFGVTAFASGYLVVWTAFGLVAAVVQLMLHRAVLLTPSLHTTSAIAGGVILVAAGLYQLTPLKQACLRRCRSPVQFLTQHRRTGATGALRMGFTHGLYCVGCCWALMALLFVGGVMNLIWIAVIAVVVLTEKLAPAGQQLARITGVGLIVWGAAVVGRVLV